MKETRLHTLELRVIRVPNQLNLVVDSREPKNVQEKMAEIAKDSDVIQSITIDTLETADFAVPKYSIGIERKEASDFAASVQDRRISEQGDRMVEEFEHRYVVLEGSGLYDLKYTSIGANSLIGQQVSLAAKRDINLINTDDVEGTAFAVRRIVERVVDGEAVGHVKTFDVETNRTDIAMLAQVDGVSVEKAEKILDEISFSAIAKNAPEVGYEGPKIVKDGITYVDGVGEKTADKIIEAFQ